MAFIAYLITNNINGKQYIGITKRGLSQRWRGHCEQARQHHREGILQMAILKYGYDQFSITQIASARTWEDLCAVERILIQQHGTRSPKGYNMTDGGEGVHGYKHSPEMIDSIRLKTIGKKIHSEEYKRQVSIRHTGKVVSELTKAAIGAKHRGKKLSKEHKAKMSAAKMGKTMPPRSKQHAERIAAGLRRAHARRRQKRQERQGILFGQ